MRLHFFLNFPAYFISGDFHIVAHLQIKPEFRLYAKILAKAQRRIRSNFPFAMNYLADPICRHIDISCQLTLRNPHWIEKFFEEGGQVLQSYIGEGKRERLKAKGSNSNVQLLIEKYV